MCDEKFILFGNRKRLAQWLDKDEVSEHNPEQNIHKKKQCLFDGPSLAQSATVL